MEYNSDPEELRLPPQLSHQSSAGMTEFPDEDDDAMEVCWLVFALNFSARYLTFVCQVADPLPFS